MEGQGSAVELAGRASFDIDGTTDHDGVAARGLAADGGRRRRTGKGVSNDGIWRRAMVRRKGGWDGGLNEGKRCRRLRMRSTGGSCPSPREVRAGLVAGLSTAPSSKQARRRARKSKALGQTYGTGEEVAGEAIMRGFGRGLRRGLEKMGRQRRRTTTLFTRRACRIESSWLAPSLPPPA